MDNRSKVLDASSSICFENAGKKIEDIIEGILSIYPQGINSIIKECETDTNHIALILVLNGTNKFVRKYMSKVERKAYVDKKSTLDKRIFPNSTDEMIVKKQAEYHSLNRSDYENTKEVIRKIKETFKMINVILEVFRELNSTEEKLVENLIEVYSKEKVLKMDKEYIASCKRIVNENRHLFKLKSFFNENYIELEFEDFVLLFCSILRYYAKIRIKLELHINSKKVLLKFFCEEKTYNQLAEFFGYELQLKPYAYKYNELNKKKSAKGNQDMTKSILQSINQHSIMQQSMQSSQFAKQLGLDSYTPALQFEELNHNNCLLFPPYMTYERSSNIKFRRYLPNDNYHECRLDPEFYPEAKNKCNECSIYRGIDKLRLLYKALTHIIPLSSLYKHNLISMIIYQKNYSAYANKLNTSTILADTLRICCSQSYMKTLNTIRNYFGENISFYFLWVSFFFTWMLFPAFLGVIGSIIMVDPQSFIYEGKIDTFKNFRLDFYDISIIAFGLIITIWATLFLQAWLKYESLFRYFWGMEHYEKTEPQSEFFVPDKTIPFIIGELIRTVTSWKTQLRYMISFFVMVLMILLRCVIVFALFYCLSFNETTTFSELFLIAGLSCVIIKIMSITYETIVYKITIWENHEKRSQLLKAQAFKLIFFQFFNNYSGMFYIAFYKPYHPIKCYANNCLKELEWHLYTLVLINFVLNYLSEHCGSIKKSIRMIKYGINLWSSSNSLEHQMSCDKMNNLIKEYNQKLIDFGYICLFSVSAPLAPLLILVLTYLQNLFDVYKVFNIYRIEMIDGSSGIESYYSKFKMFNYIGMITNTCLVLFTSPKLVHLDEYFKNKITNNEDFIIKIIIFTIIENVMLLFMNVVKYKENMIWFQHVDDLKILYDKKYFSRDYKKLPHITSEQHNRYAKDSN